MRKLMWFTLGFGAVCLFCGYVWPEISLLPAALALVLAGVLLFAATKWKFLRVGAAVALGVAAGLIWCQCVFSFYLSDAGELDGKTVSLEARCTDYGYATAYGTAADGVTRLNGKPYRIRLYVNEQADMEPGDVLSGEFHLRLTTPDGEDAVSYFQGEGIFLLGYQESEAELGKVSEMPWWGFPAKLRQNILTLIDGAFPADTAGFAKALLLGERSGIDYRTNTDFKISGISHIIAVSGLHVSILCGLVYGVTLHRRWPMALLGIPLLLLFAAVAGFSPSVTRACVMQILLILGLLLEKEYDPPTALSFACLAMMAANPLVVLSVSFQLSVSCMVGIFLFRGRIYDYLTQKLNCRKKKGIDRLKRWFVGSVAMSVSANLVTTPLVAWYFHTVSLISVLTNLLALWAVTIIFYGIMLVCLTAAVWPVAGAVLAWVAAWPIRYVLAVSHLLARFPLAAVYTGSIYVVLWLILCYLLLTVFLCQKKREPMVPIVCAVIGLVLTLAASWSEPLLDECRMTVLDVGQGQCILLQSEGKTYLVDCGGSDDEKTADIAAETLLSQGIIRLDGVIVTHYDRDHTGGLPYLLTRIPADYLFLPDVEDATGMRQRLTFENSIFISQDLLLSFGDTDLTIFSPAQVDSDNERSMCILFQTGKCDILITGDRSSFGEKLLLLRHDLPRLEVLVAGHHGSAYSTSEDLLRALQPEVVAISVGDNPYGHPAQALLARLSQYNCAVYRTDLHGNIIFRR